MKEVTLFCVPGEVYRGKDPLQVSKDYTKMASEDFDEMVVFDEKYDKNKIDYQERTIFKEGIPIDLTVFAKQPVVGIYKDSVNIISSSNLFNPPCPHKKKNKDHLYYPDLEVIQIHGSIKDNNKMISVIEELYAEKNGWKVKEFGGKISEMEVKCQSGRFSTIKVLDPKRLRDIAHEFFSYSLEKLCFQ